jgi:iron complex outermembrane receptor protein
MHQQQPGLLTLAGALVCLTIQPASAESKSTGTEVLVQTSEINRIRDLSETSATAITAIPRVKDRQRAFTTVREWLAQDAQPKPIQITGVRLNPTEQGLDVILETLDGELPAPTPTTAGNKTIVEIPNAVLVLPGGQGFQSSDPEDGIASVSVTQLNATTVQITVTGTEKAATVSVRSSDRALTLSVTPTLEEEEVVVTAQKRPEPAQNVPISLTVIPRQTLEDAQIDSFQKIANNTPNFSFFPTNAGGSDFSYYSIRGLNNFNFLVSQDSVGYYIDDVPFDFGAFLDLGLLDLERVEVLRGPQSTLYGRSSPAGVVNVISRPPTNFSEFRIAGGYGNYNLRETQLSYSNAIIPDQLSLRLAGAYRARDGVFENETLDRSVGEREQILGRAQLLWTPSKEWSVSFNSYINDANNGDPVFTRQDADDPFKTFKAVDGFVRLNSNTQALRIGYNGSGVRATSITARRFSNQEVLAGDSFAPPLDFARSVIDFKSTVWTQEIRLQSPESADRFKWLLGGYYESRAFDANDAFDYTALGATFFGLPEAGQNRVIADQLRTTYAVFGQVDFKPVEPLTLFAGLRFEASNFDIDRLRRFDTATSSTILIPRVQLEDTSSEFIPRFGLQYRFSPTVMAYATIAKGYRPDGFNYRADTADTRRYQEEKTWTYETGVKTSWFGDRLTANFSFFHNDVDGYQVLLVDNFGFFRNIASADVSATGFEFELKAQPTKGLEFVAGLGYVNSRFTSYKNPLTGTDLSDNRVPFAPDVTYNIAVQYRAPIGIFARLELQGYGKTFFDDANQVKQDPFALVNLRLGYEWRNYGIYVFANNLFDTRYITSGFQFPPPSVTAGFGEPVTYGFQIRATF